MTAPNPSTALARVIVDELWRQGVSYAVISPGSRSGALAIAFDQHPGIDTVVALDERAAAFRALGRAKSDGLPAAAVATSGTAGANFLPAVVEADLSATPLLLLTADRPAELLAVGANQTIDQIGLFGGKVRWAAQVPTAEAVPDGNGFWRTVAAQAAARAMGYGGPPGPVHLNVAFREPTVPVSDDGRSKAPAYSDPIDGAGGDAPWQKGVVGPAAPVSLDIAPPSRAIVVAGEGHYARGDLVAAATELGWPILATASSGLRGGNVVTTYHHLLVDGAPTGLQPDLVLSVGRTGPSDRLASLGAGSGPVIHVDPSGRWHDPLRRATHLIQGDPVGTLRLLGGEAEPGWQEGWSTVEEAMRAILDEHISSHGAPTGPALAVGLRDVSVDRIVVASSMPVRDVDAHLKGPARVVANRGASGIDGLVSTALGAASAGGSTLALAGDLSLLHDLSGFIGDDRSGLVVMVADNGGGGLFDLLPQAAHAPGFERLFVAPHGLDLVDVIRALGWEAERTPDVDSAIGEVRARLGGRGRHAVVVPIDREGDLKVRMSLDRAAREFLAASP